MMKRDDIIDQPDRMPGDMIPLLFPTEWHLVTFVCLAIVGFFTTVAAIIDTLFAIIEHTNHLL